MTTNAFIFAWDCYGIESIVPISQYEHIDRDNTMRILAEKPRVPNPMDSILRNLMLRATINTQRNYEIYAIDCEEHMDKAFWAKQWQEHPQETAELIRDCGHKLYSDRSTVERTIE